jgi:superfamily I DNA and/or RNA helicase
VIAEVIKRLWATQPTPRIVLASQTHVALDNALERLEQEFVGEGRRPEILRVGHPDDPRISSTVKHLLLDETLKRWAREVEERSKEWLEGFAKERGLARDVLTVAWHVKRLIGEKLAMDSLESQLALLSDDGAPAVREKAVQAVLNDSSALDEMAPEARARVRDKLARHRAQQDRIVKELRALGKDEASLADKETSALKDLLEGLLRDLPQEQQFLAMLDVQSSWLQEFGADPKEFSRALLVRADIVAGTCIGLAGVEGFQEADFDLAILDEASKATTLEALVPLSRARKLVLVGDPKQLPPFNRDVSQGLLERHDVSKEDLTQTMLDIVRDGLPADNCVRLETQFRMVPAIGQLISEVFYDGGLRGGSVRTSVALSAVFPTPVTWLTTSFEEERNESRAGRSFANYREVDVVQAVLLALSEASEKVGEELSVALLTGYAAQRDAVGRMVHSLAGRAGGLKLDWGTVDAYQGREADICIYSVTRSNAESGQGFLADERRMNVALSRGSLGLIVVGDHKFCEKSQGTTLARVLAFMRAHDDTCKVFSAAGKGY